MKILRLSRRTAWILAISIPIIGSVGLLLWHGYLHKKQALSSFIVRTQSSRLLEESVKLGRNLTTIEAEKLLSEYGDGKDQWGNQLLYILGSAAGEGQFKNFLLISPGRDGKLDLEAPYAYFDIKEEDVTGKRDRDIVNNTGKVVWFALH